MNKHFYSDLNHTASRRKWLKSAAAWSLVGLAGCAHNSSISSRAKVVVIGGGYGGNTAAKYVRLLSDYKIDVVLTEPEAAFISCPLSNLVLSGGKKLDDLTMTYDGLARNHGITVVRDHATVIDTARKTVKLAGGATLAYDKLIVSPGVELMLSSIEGLQQAKASGRILQAWKAGAETLGLRKQLEAMPDGGVFAIAIPEAPYRCPPGPYERASLVASYFKLAKPRSKVLILDANPDVTSEGELFKKAWAEQYNGIIEYRSDYKAIAVDAKASVIKFEMQDDVKANVLNVLPAMRAGTIAVQARLNNQADKRWCGVNFLTFESTAAKDVHVLGDSIQVAPAMAKSGQMANSQGKVAAAAIVAELSGWAVNPAPMLTNTCYSFVNNQNAIHVASVHAYVPAEKTFRTVPGAGGLSTSPNELEGVYAMSWATNIWADMLN